MTGPRLYLTPDSVFTAGLVTGVGAFALGSWQGVVVALGFLALTFLVYREDLAYQEAEFLNSGALAEIETLTTRVKTLTEAQTTADEAIVALRNHLKTRGR